MFLRNGQGLGSVLYRGLPAPDQPKKKRGRPRKETTAGAETPAKAAPKPPQTSEPKVDVTFTASGSGGVQATSKPDQGDGGTQH